MPEAEEELGVGELEPIQAPQVVSLNELNKLAQMLTGSSGKVTPEQQREGMPDRVKKLVALGEGSKLEVMVDPVQNLVVRAVLMKTRDTDREAHLTGLDVTYLQYSPKFKKYRQLRTPLSRMRLDQLRIAGEEFPASPKSQGEAQVVRSSDQIAEGLDTEQFEWLRSGAGIPAQAAVSEKDNITCPQCGNTKHYKQDICDGCRELLAAAQAERDDEEEGRL
jgi:hypothetical protein